MFPFGRLPALFRRKPASPFEDAVRAIDRGRPAQALVLLDELASGDGTANERAAIANKRGVALVGLHRPDEARAAFACALDAVPRYAPALVNLGNLHLESGELDAAVARYEAAVAADDAYAPAHYHLGIVYKRLGRLNDAVRELRRGQRLLH